MQSAIDYLFFFFSKPFLFTHTLAHITFVLSTILKWYHLFWMRFPFSRSSGFECRLASHFIFKPGIRCLNHVQVEYSRLIHLFDWMHGGLIDKRVKNKQWVRWKKGEWILEDIFTSSMTRIANFFIFFFFIKADE